MYYKFLSKLCSADEVELGKFLILFFDIKYNRTGNKQQTVSYPVGPDITSTIEPTQ